MPHSARVARFAVLARVVLGVSPFRGNVLLLLIFLCAVGQRHYYSEGLRPSDSPTRSLVGPQMPHSARVARFAVLARVVLGVSPLRGNVLYSLYSFALSATVIRTFRSGTFAFNPASSSMPVVSGSAIWPPSMIDRYRPDMISNP
jgi:hypothetical protein